MINWTSVELAMRRSATGLARAADQELCEKAYKSDPKRYAELSRKVRNEEFEFEARKWSSGR